MADSVTLAERYVLESPIASGGMATVWRARDDVLARTVAVKVLHPTLADDEAFVERFRREALAAARLAHSNIVSIYDTGAERSDDDVERNFIVMEFCPGGTLADVTEREGPLDAAKAFAIGCGVCDALSYAHSQGVIHRDIKPANVLLTADGTLKVADFGIAKAAYGQGDITTTGSILGTVTYLSPEQVNGNEPDARSDLYALGVLLYELLAGRPPFAAETQIAVAMKHAREDPPPLRSLRAGINRQTEAVVMKALQKDPDERYPSAQDMKRALESISGRDAGTTAAFPAAERGPSREPAPGPPGRKPGVAREARSFLPVALLIVAAILLVLLVPPLLRSDDPQEPTGNNGDQTSTNDGNGDGLRVESASSFDPEGDNSEHDDEVSLAFDGNVGTTWTTENYNASFELLGKSGVGIVFDLGDSQALDAVRVNGSAGSLELRAADSENSDASDYEMVAESDGIDDEVELEAEGTEARYWLVWITSLPGGEGGTASIAEVEFLGS